MQAFESYEWSPVHAGHSGVPTYRLTAPERAPLFAKRLARGGTMQPVPEPEGGSAQNLPTAPPRPAGHQTDTDLLGEAERIVWLRKAGLPGPELVDVGVSDDVQWLVMTEVRGRSGAEDWPAARRNVVIDAIADMLHLLHAIPIEECPFQADLARLATRDGVEQLEPWWPTIEDRVVTHGDYCLPNMLLDPETLQPAGFIDLGELGIADRYRDLAAAGMSIASDELNPQYDQTQAARFFTRYGADPDDPRREFYLRAYGLA